MTTASLSRPDARHAVPAAENRIGPNAVTQLITALEDAGQHGVLTTLLTELGHAEWHTAPPQAMIPVHLATRMHLGVRRLLPPREAEAILAHAGERTGAYLLANRIPASARTILRWLPGRLAGPVLLRAIAAHAWTFAGSDRFSWGRNVAMIADNPLCHGLISDRPACHWHAAVLQTLWRAFVAADVRVIETTCCARGDAACTFRFVRGSADEFAR